MKASRRKFLTRSLTAAGFALGAGAQVVAAERLTSTPARRSKATAAKIRFSAVGLNHGHIYSQVETVRKNGGTLVSFFAVEDDLASAFSKQFPDARRARDVREILEDNTIQLVVSASIPDERAPLGIEVMRHGKDFMSDKPGIVSLEQLAQVRKVQEETRRIYSIFYGERLENPATVKAGELVREGAIGKVIQTIGLGPHRLNIKSRPAWFFDRSRYGGIICDIGTHQCDQFLYFTGSTEADVVCSQVGNIGHSDHPGLEDFGDATFRGNGGTGYIRVDWFTPDGLATWGDARLTILGTDGFIEIRKNIDIGGRSGGNHLFITDNKSTRYMDCSDGYLPYGEQLVNDVVNRTETAMSQRHCFLVTELALKAQAQAARLRLPAQR